jgi:hypothetical protein
MHKYAALTALIIALNITMLALTVSASLTPANAGWNSYCDNEVCLCQLKCGKYLDKNVSRVWPDIPVSSQFLACIASCGRTEGVEILSRSALRARVTAKKAARR